MIETDFHTTLNALEEPVLLVNRDKTINFLNTAAGELFGKGLVGQPLVRALRQPDALRCIDEAIEGRVRSRVEIQTQTPQRATYQLTAVHLDGRGPAASVSLRDVTPLVQAAQMRSDFVANVSHELRSPLTTLSGLIETLGGAAKDDPEAQARFLGIMQREAGRMDRLIGDLLSLSKVEADERIRPTKRVDVAAITRRVLADLQSRSGSEMREMTFDTEDDQCLVVGDEDQLTQVFQNLIENAVKYSKPETKVSVAIRRLSEAPRFAGAVWAISVKDRGDGIAAEHIPRLTERFYRVDSGRSRQMGGTGLGLAIVKHIVSRHRGQFRIESVVGEGSIMTVHLPVASA